MQRSLTKGPITKGILLFALPLMFGNLLQQMYNIADTWVVGRFLGADALAAVGSSYTLMTFLTSILLGLCMGSGAAVSMQYGSGEEARMRQSVFQSFVLIAGMAVALNVLVYLGLGGILWVLRVPEEIIPLMKEYLRIIFLGITATFLYNYFANLLRAIGNSVVPLLFLAVSAVLNVILDLVCVLVLHWGVAGAAGATVTAQLISTVACFAYAFSKYPDLRLHKEDWRITGLDLKRHIVQGVPLGLQFSVLAIGIIVMQSVVVKFDMIDGQMVSHAAQNGFGAANKLNSLIMTPVNGLGTAMTSFTAQNLGAGYTHRIRKGILQGLVMAAIIGVCSVGLGLLLTIDGAYLHIFLSADKVTADTIRFGNHFLYVDFSMYLLLCFLFVIRNCVQGIQRAPFVLWAGASELIARVAICLTLPALLSGGVVSAQSPELAFYALCAADPLAWLAADLALLVPFFKNMMHMNYQYLYGGVEQHLLGK